MAKQWLLKTEPSAYSFGQLQRDGRTLWDGVKNPMALKHLREIRTGDQLFIYHTGDEKAVVGTATAVSDAYVDPKRGPAVDIAPTAPLARPVTLAEIKADPRFKQWELVRLPRLSVMPVSAEHWRAIEQLARAAR